MKKLNIILTVLMCLVLLSSCVGKDKIPKGEYELTVVDDYPSILCEPLEKSYKPGEVITVKTYTVCDASYKLTLNGEKAKKYEQIHEENDWFYVWEFEMPAKNSLLEIQWYSGMDAYYYKLTLNDPNNLVINSFPHNIASRDMVKINTLRADVCFTTSPKVNIDDGKAVKNSYGEILYYSWSFEMPKSDLTVEITPQNNENNQNN